jgi:hypothetical protein
VAEPATALDKQHVDWVRDRGLPFGCDPRYTSPGPCQSNDELHCLPARAGAVPNRPTAPAGLLIGINLVDGGLDRNSYRRRISDHRRRMLALADAVSVTLSATALGGGCVFSASPHQRRAGRVVGVHGGAIARIGCSAMVLWPNRIRRSGILAAVDEVQVAARWWAASVA